MHAIFRRMDCPIPGCWNLHFGALLPCVPTLLPEDLNPPQTFWPNSAKSKVKVFEHAGKLTERGKQGGWWEQWCLQSMPALLQGQPCAPAGKGVALSQEGGCRV